MTQLNRAANMLFPSTGASAANIKFFAGTSRAVTAEQLAEQFVRAETQIRHGDAVACNDIDD
jgi:hypothetical protein